MVCNTVTVVMLRTVIQLGFTHKHLGVITHKHLRATSHLCSVRTRLDNCHANHCAFLLSNCHYVVVFVIMIIIMILVMFWNTVNTNRYRLQVCKITLTTSCYTQWNLDNSWPLAIGLLACLIDVIKMVFGHWEISIIKVCFKKVSRILLRCLILVIINTVVHYLFNYVMSAIKVNYINCCGTRWYILFAY